MAATSRDRAFALASFLPTSAHQMDTSARVMLKIRTLTAYPIEWNG